MRLISYLLKPALVKAGHILVDSAQLVQQLRHVRVPAGAYLVTIDVDDLFMDGAHQDLIAACSLHVAMEWRGLFRALLRFVLDTQYVVLDHAQDTAWKVICGAGMGLGCSGDVCDVAFLASVENGLVDIPAVTRSFGVIGYYRHRDDILVILDGDVSTTSRFIGELKRRCSIWKLSVDTVSRDGASFLDLSLKKDSHWRRTGCLDISVFHKPSGQHVYLTPTSSIPSQFVLLGLAPFSSGRAIIATLRLPWSLK